jgi:putative membrane-bound dehydrogenase-like protein
MKLTYKIRAIAQFGKILTLPLIFLGASAVAQRYPGPLSPEESLKKLQIAKGLKAQIYAAEPYVFDPVSLEFDESGNAYVVEMYDYPFEAEPGKGRGRIRLLKDTNGDGRVDQSSVFAENLTEATSVLPWKGGVIVTAAPNILYLKDTNGDGKADVREILFSGFFQNNSEAQVTSLRLGVDNWIYANNRGQSGLVTFSRAPGVPPIAVRGADFRFRLDKNLFELETGPGQFGQTIDDFGRRFFTENSIHLQQTIIPWRYSHRHAFLPTSKFNVRISDHEELMYETSETPYWRAERTKQRNKAFQEAGLNQVEYANGHFTGASGGTAYVGNGLPASFYGNIFTSDVSGNLVHRDILVQSETTPLMIAKRAEMEAKTEFITSTDTWFRPITFTTGPDGYLYVLDFYRQHIETPVSIPDELKKDMEFMAGSDKGRIYRILPEGSEFKQLTVNLTNTKSADLVAMLDNPNGWWRQQAHRLLLERQDKSVIPAVVELFNQSKDPISRLNALYVLEALDALNVQIVLKALGDESEGVRENAIILAERYAETLPEVIEKTKDKAIRVVFQAALSLGEFKAKEVVPAMAAIVEKHGASEWFRSAILSSEAGSSTELLKLLVQSTTFSKTPDSWKLAFIEDFTTIIGNRNNKEQAIATLNLLSQPAFANEVWQLATIKGFKKGLLKITTLTPATKKSVTALNAAKGNGKIGIQSIKDIYK